MTKIAKRASICPQCRSDLSVFGGIKSFFQTGAWVLTTLISLGYAAYEKAEKMGFETKLEEKTSQLEEKASQLFLSNLIGESWKAMRTDPYAEPPLEFAADGTFETGEPTITKMLLPAPEDVTGDADNRVSRMMAQEPAMKEPRYDPKEVLRIEQRLKVELSKDSRDLNFIKRLVDRKQYLLFLKSQQPQLR